MATIRRAEAIWEGDLRGGEGHVSAKSSGAAKGLDASRFAELAPAAKDICPVSLAAIHC